MIVETLRALYELAPACDVCEEHRATQCGWGMRRSWVVCDRADCVEVLACAACPVGSRVPRDGSTPCCLEFGCGEVHRASRSSSWRDLPHAAALRAANAAHEAGT